MRSKHTYVYGRLLYVCTVRVWRHSHSVNMDEFEWKRFQPLILVHSDDTDFSIINLSANDSIRNNFFWKLHVFHKESQKKAKQWQKSS